MKIFAIMMILILTQQTVLSQSVITDTIKKTITLNREKKIEVAKIILNENALFEENLILKESIKKLESGNSDLLYKISILEKEVLGKKDEVIGLQDKIISDKERFDLKESKNNDFGLYFISTFQTGPDGGVGLGGSIVKQKFSFGLTIKPKTNQSDNSYSAIVGFKIF